MVTSRKTDAIVLTLGIMRLAEARDCGDVGFARFFPPFYVSSRRAVFWDELLPAVLSLPQWLGSGIPC